MNRKTLLMKAQLLSIILCSMSLYGMTIYNYFADDSLLLDNQDNDLLSETINRFKVHDYFTNEFINSRHQQHILEYTIYKLLKEQPLKANINYLAVPWIELHATQKLYNKEFMARYNLPNTLNGGFTVCTYFNGPNDPETNAIFTILKQIGIDIVFTTDAFVSIDSYMDIKVLPLPLHVHDPVDPNTIKDILCSFIGFTSHPIRKYVVSLDKLNSYYIRLRNHAPAFYFVSEAERKKLKDEYNDILARSRFCICLRGYEPGIFRFWESLQAGAIPVLISDNWRLPGTQQSWEKAIIKIEEAAFKKDPFIVDRVIRAVTPEQEMQKRQACLALYKKYSGENLISTIREYYDKK